MRVWVLLLTLAVVLVSCDSPEDAWTIQGDSVFVNDSKVYINVTPHTAVEDEINIDFYTKSYSGGAYMMFRSNISQIQPVAYEYWNPHATNTSEQYNCNPPFVWNYTSNPIHMYCWDTSLPQDFLVFDHVCNYYNIPQNMCGWYNIGYTNWSRVPGEYTVIPYNQGGNTHVWLLNISQINAQQLYKTRIIVKTRHQEMGKPQDPAYKYDWGIMPSTYPANLEGIMRALEDRNIYYIDPWTRGTTGMLAYYNLNQTSNTSILDSHGTRHGTLNHNAAQNSSGKISYATTLDGNQDDITFGGTALSDTVGSFAFWAYNNAASDATTIREGFGSANNLIYLAGASTSTFSGEIIMVQTSANKVAWGTAELGLGVGGSIPIGWHHYVFVHNSTTTNWMLYLDGSLTGTPNVSGTPPELAAQDITIGSNSGGATSWYGTFDEVGFWSDELTAAEASWLYHSGTGISYPFTEAATNQNPTINNTEYLTRIWQTETLEINATFYDDLNTTINWSITINDTSDNNITYAEGTATNGTEKSLLNITAATFQGHPDGTWDMTIRAKDQNTVTPGMANTSISWLVIQDNQAYLEQIERNTSMLYGHTQEINATIRDDREFTISFDISIFKDNVNQTSLYRTSTTDNTTLLKSIQNVSWAYAAQNYTLFLRYWDSYNTTKGMSNYSWTTRWGITGGQFNITAQNVTGGTSSISNFWAVVNGTNYTTSNGTINTPIQATSCNLFTYDIVVDADNFTASTNNLWNCTHNLQANLTANPTDSMFKIYAYNSTSGNTITSFWAYANTTNYTTTNGTIITIINIGLNATQLIDIMVGAAGYNNTNHTSYNFSVNLNASLDTLGYDYHKDIIDKAYFNNGNTSPSGWTYAGGTGSHCTFNSSNTSIEGGLSLEMQGSGTQCYPSTNLTVLSGSEKTTSFFMRTDTSKVQSYFYVGTNGAAQYDAFGFGENGSFVCNAYNKNECVNSSYAADKWYYFEYSFDEATNRRNFTVKNSTGGLLVSATQIISGITADPRGDFFKSNSSGKIFVDRVLTWNGTSAQNPYPFTFGEEFRIYAYNGTSGTPLTSFWAVVNGTNITTSNGSVYTNINKGYNGTELIDVLVDSDYFNPTEYLNYNFSSNLNSSLSFGEVSDCSGGGTRVLNFSFFDEESSGVLAFDTMDVELLYGYSYGNLSFNFTDSETGDSTYSICSETNFTGDLYMKHTRTDAFTNRFYLYNITLSGVGSAYSLYNLDNVTDYSSLLVTVRSKDNYNYVENIVVGLQRNYLGEGVWRTVQMDKSGDFGLATFKIREEDTDYKLVFKDTENHVLLTTASLKFYCDAGVCEVTALVSPWEIGAVDLNLTYSVLYDNSSNLINLSWSNVDGDTSTINFRVQKENMIRTVNLCDVNQTGSAGSYSCNVTGYAGEVFVEVLIAGQSVYGEWVKVQSSPRKLAENLDAEEQAFWTFGILVTCFMFGLFSPVAAIVATVFGVVGVYFLGIFNPFSMVIVILVGVVGIAVGLKVRR